MTKTPRTGSKLTYVALLRGINLSGHKIVRMDQLRKAFEGLGFEDVKTYIQSGNVVFKGPGTVRQKLVKRIEEKIALQFGFPVPVVVKTSDEIGEIIRNNPLVKEKGIDASKLHVTFLSCAPQKSALTTLDAFAADPDQFRCSVAAIYLHCPNGYHQTKLGNNVLGKMLRVGTTTRNWKTVNQVYGMTLG